MQVQRGDYPEITSYGDEPSCPLSFQQERVLYLNKLSDEGPLWNRISCKRLVGTLDERVLRDALRALVERHAALRTRIVVVDGVHLQSKRGSAEGGFEGPDEIDVSSLPPAAREARARAILAEEYERPMALEGGPLFKAALVRCSESERWLILKLHHIISDATTLRILWDDLKALYNARRGGGDVLRPPERSLDPPPAIDCFDYARWAREHLGAAQTARQEEYWLCRFEGALPELDLPTDRPAPAGLSFNGALERLPLSPERVRQLHGFSLDRRVIAFSTLLSAYFLLLHHYCRQDDIVIGTVFGGRHYSPKLARVAGFFSNTVALRARLDRAQTVEELVKSVHALVTEAYEMQDYPFQRLVDRLNPGREHRRNPLFRAMFNMINEPRESRAFAGIDAEEWREPEISATQVDLFLDFRLTPDASELRVEYNADLFEGATIRRMLRHYLTLLGKMLDAPRSNALGLSLLDEVEERRVLSFGEGPAEPAPFQGVVELLEERAARAPSPPALLYAGGALACAQVNARANQVAAMLARAGVGVGDVVAIMVERSPEMVIGILGILKAGAAYLPIDPSFPRKRVEYMLEDSGARRVLVASEAHRGIVPEGAPRVIALDVAPQPGDERNPGVERRAHADSPCYVIYTSGSTGKPKGVVVSHGALMNTLRFLDARFALDGKTLLLKTNYTFDVSAAELFGWIFADGRLSVLEPGAERDPAKLIEAIATFGVTHVNFVPSMLDAMLAGLAESDVPTLERLKYVFVAGEALKPDLVERFYQAVRDVRLEDLYGPTEAAVYATWFSLPRGQKLERVPIGKPIANTRAYILDGDLKLIPVGLTGELCLAGAGLALGYLGAPELTAEKFCASPYRDGERLYRTGDLAQWDEEGQIQFLGRADGQVKIRGFRVEIGEVERRLSACSGVAESAVVARTDRFGQKRLVAYVVGAGAGSIEDVRKDLSVWLPAFMIPEAFVELPQLPRLPSGKVDLRALPDPRATAVTPSAPAPAPPNDLERTIIGIAESLLNTTGLDANSNFFDLGGNSLLTLRFIAALDDALGTRLSVMDFLSLPTIGEIAQIIAASGPTPRDAAI